MAGRGRPVTWCGRRRFRRTPVDRLVAGAVGAFDGARELDTRAHAEFAEDVAQVRLDGLLTEEQRRGDLGVGLAVDDEAGELELARAERPDSRLVRLARPAAPVHGMAEFAQLALGI